MSLTAITWAYTRAPIPDSTQKGEPQPAVLLATLLSLADGYGDEIGLAFRSVPNIAARTRHDERTIRAALRALQDYGLIEPAEDQSVVSAIVKRADRRPVGYHLSLHLDNGGEHLAEGDRARARTAGRATPPLQPHGGASDPSRGGERSVTGGRATPRSQEEPKREQQGSSRVSGSLAEGHADADLHAAIRAEILECELCDEEGYRGRSVCDHIDRTATAARGAARVRAVLAGNVRPD